MLKTTPTPEQLLLAKNFSEAMAQPGAPTPGAIAAECDISEQAVSNWKRTGKINKKNLAVVSRLTGWSISRLMSGQEDTKNQAEDAGRPKVTRPTPVVGTAKLGDDGFFEEMQHPTGHGDGFIDGHTSDPNAYALRVKGDSMHPAIRHGWFVVVAPEGRCVPGEYIAIQLADGRKMVKELVIERPDEIVIESVNGNHRQTISKTDVEKMHPVCAVVSSSQWRPA